MDTNGTTDVSVNPQDPAAHAERHTQEAGTQHAASNRYEDGGEDTIETEAEALEDLETEDTDDGTKAGDGDSDDSKEDEQTGDGTQEPEGTDDNTNGGDNGGHDN